MLATPSEDVGHVTLSKRIAVYGIVIEINGKGTHTAVLYRGTI